MYSTYKVLIVASVTFIYAVIVESKFDFTILMRFIHLEPKYIFQNIKNINL